MWCKGSKSPSNKAFRKRKLLPYKNHRIKSFHKNHKTAISYNKNRKTGGIFAFKFTNQKTMRRKDKEITDIDEKLNIIAQNTICRLALFGNDYPYIVPLNYGFSYHNGTLTLYFHGATEGKKMELIKKNNRACFEIDCDTQLITGEKTCSYGYEFKSIIGFGKISIAETSDEKITGLNYLMKQQTGNDTKYDFTEHELKKVCVFTMTVEDFSGKQKKSIFTALS